MYQELKKIVFKIAEVKLERRLTEAEKQRIESIYDTSNIVDVEERSIYALQKALNVNIEERLLEERHINFSLDAIQMLMIQLKKEASKQNSKGK